MTKETNVWTSNRCSVLCNSYSLFKMNLFSLHLIFYCRFLPIQQHTTHNKLSLAFRIGFFFFQLLRISRKSLVWHLLLVSFSLYPIQYFTIILYLLVFSSRFQFFCSRSCELWMTVLCELTVFFSIILWDECDITAEEREKTKSINCTGVILPTVANRQSDQDHVHVSETHSQFQKFVSNSMRSNIIFSLALSRAHYHKSKTKYFFAWSVMC